MKDIRKPGFFGEAVHFKNRSMLREVLTAFLLFFIGTFMGALIQTPVMMVYFLTDKEYLNMISSGRIDNQTIMEMVSKMPNWVVALTLCGTAGTLIATIFYYKVIEKRSLLSLGFQKKRAAGFYLFGMLLGTCFLGCCYLSGSVMGIYRIDFSMTGEKAVPVILLFFVGYMIQGLAEEVLCRGFLFVVLTKKYPVFYALILSSLFYALLHGFHNNVSILAYINLILFGGLMGLLFLRFENIWLVGAFHGICDFILTNVFGMKESGLEADEFLFSVQTAENSDVLHGGKYGLTGGLLLTIVLVFAILLLLVGMYHRQMIIPIEENFVQEEKEEVAPVLLEYREFKRVDLEREKPEPYPPIGKVEEMNERILREEKETSTVFDRDYFKD